MLGPLGIHTPIRFDDSLPDGVDVVIIGAGVVGVFAGLYLNRLGKRVLVCEKGRVAAEQSSRNWGWIRQHGRDEAEIPITSHAVRLWHQVNQQTGGACGVKTTGIAYLADTEKDMEGFLAWLDIAKTYELDSYAMSQSALATMFDQPHAGKWLGGTCTPSDCKGEPWQAVPAVAELAHQEGVLIKEHCAVRNLLTSAGRVSGVVTEYGEVACEQVLLAGGAWSSVFARRLGVNLPQLTVEATVVQTQPLDVGVAHAFADSELAMRPRDDGGYSLALTDSHGFYLGPDSFRHARRFLPLLRKSWHDIQFKGLSPTGYSDSWDLARDWQGSDKTPFEHMRVMDPAADGKRVQRIQQRFAQRFPQQPEVAVINAWSGMIDAMPDVVPVVDQVDSMPGFYLATGMSAHGFGIGPGYGRIMARMLAEQAPEHDLQRFRLQRFTDGSKLVVGPAL